MSQTSTFWSFTALLIIASPVPVSAACSAALPLVNTTVPTLPGRIVFQGASASGDTQLYTFDFASKVQTAISASWGLTALRNPAFSPDGKRVAFTGVSGNTRDDYVFAFGATVPVNLTNGSSTGAVSEDPKWSADGTKLIIKQNGNILIATLTFNASGVPSIASTTALTTDGVRGQPSERSQPYLSPDSKYAYYVRGTGTGQRVKYTTVTSPSEQQFAQNGFYSYYPIVRDYTVIYYTGWTSSSGPYDQIFLQLPSINGPTVTQPSFNACNADNSDAAPVDSDYLIFSSDSAALQSSGTYRAVLTSLYGGQVWDLTRIGAGSGIAGPVLGISYTAAR